MLRKKKGKIEPVKKRGRKRPIYYKVYVPNNKVVVTRTKKEAERVLKWLNEGK